MFISFPQGTHVLCAHGSFRFKNSLVGQGCSVSYYLMVESALLCKFRTAKTNVPMVEYVPRNVEAKQWFCFFAKRKNDSDTRI